MRALVLEGKGCLTIRDIEIRETLGPTDVRIAIGVVGICGSDIHYYVDGAIGPYVVDAPMVLGHEAAGVITEVGSAVTTLKVGDRVCIEPGVPTPGNENTRMGRYNLDPGVRFWATPPIHGCLRPSVIHPAAYTYQIPENVSLEEGAMVEPFAVGLHATIKARIVPGELVLVTGAGPIGMVTALAALAAGCSQVIITDVQQQRLSRAEKLGGIIPVNVRDSDAKKVISQVSKGKGVRVAFECSGAASAFALALDALAPGGVGVFVGMPSSPVEVNVVAAQTKELRIETVFRYAHVFPLAISLMSSRRIDVRPLITHKFAFNDAVAAFDYAKSGAPDAIKIQIQM